MNRVDLLLGKSFQLAGESDELLRRPLFGQVGSRHILGKGVKPAVLGLKRLVCLGRAGKHEGSTFYDRNGDGS